MSAPVTAEQMQAVMTFVGQARAMYGKAATARVEALLERLATGRSRYFDLDGIQNTGWLEPSSHPDLPRLIEAVDRFQDVLVADAQKVAADWPNLPAFGHYSLGVKSDADWRFARISRATSCAPEALVRFPASTALVADQIGALCGSGDGVIFSALEPGATIPLHRDMANTGMSLHFGLIVPDGCTLTVGDESRTWQRGKPLLFNYGAEHTARNPSGEVRVVLICDVWNPEVTLAERAMLNTLALLRAKPSRS